MAMFMKMLPMSVSKHITGDSWSSLLFFAKLVYMDNRRVDLKAKAFIIEHGDGAADDHIGEFANGFARYLYTVSRSGGSAPGGHVVRGADSQSRTCDQEAHYGTAAKHFLEARESFRAGRVAICWYDRRNDPQNLNIERFCAESKNGNEWSNFRVPITPFTPIHRLDLVVSPAY